MSRRPAAERRSLGLWTAAWLAAFLLGGLLWVGQVAGEWLLLLVPAVWALVAVRPRQDPGPADRDGG